jgi:hypothetical protein
MAITIDIRQTGRRRPLAEPLTLDLDGGVTLRALIERVVASELAAYEQHRRERAVLRALTEREIDAAAQQGKIDAGGVDTPPPPPLDAAVETALTAFTDGLYFVFVDDVQVDALQAELHLQPNSRVLFLRLVALAGG